MKKNLLKLAALLPLVSATTLTSCGGDTLVGVTYYNLGDSNMANSWQPMYKYLSEVYGWQYKEVNGNGQNAEIQNGVTNLINNGASGLIVNLNQPTQASQIVTQAKNADVPIVLYNKEPATDGGVSDPTVVDGYDKAFFVGTTSSEAGDMQAELAFNWLKAHMNSWDVNGDGKLSIFVIKGEDGHAEAEARTEHCVSHLKELLNTPGHGIVNSSCTEITGTDIDHGADDVKTAIATGGATWDGATAKSMVAQYIHVGNNVNYDIVFSNNDDMAVAALGDSSWPEGVPVWGVDCSASGVNSIKSSATNRLAGSVYNDNITQPRVAAFLMNQLLQGKTREECVEAAKAEFGDVFTYEETGHAFRIKYTAVTAENVDTVVQTAAAWIEADKAANSTAE